MSEHTPIADLLDLSGQVAIVTGAPGQLGEAISETLAELGAHVVAISRTESDCRELAQELSRDYQESLAIAADVTDPEEVTAAVDHTIDQFNGIDILVNCAYSGETVPFEEMTVQQFQSGINAALTSTFLTTRESIPALRDCGGSIVNIASIYGLVAPDHRIYADTGLNNPAHYGAAKAGVIQLTRWIATRYAEDNVRANVITPGGFYNPNLECRTDYNDKFVKNYESRTPLGRMGQPDDLKGAIALLTSDASKWITGQNIIVDGGWTVW